MTFIGGWATKIRAARVRAALAATAGALFALMATSAAAQYPNPAADFAHPAQPHAPLLSFYGGDRDRPLLAIYNTFSDTGANANLDSAQLATRVFGTGLAGNWPSAMEYLRRSSSGKLDITPAAESDTSGSGAADDGVVRADHTATTRNTYAALSPAEQIKRALEKADASVDFKQFDTNGDNAIGNDELVIIVFQSGTAAVGIGSGAVFPQGPPALDVTLDTKKIAGTRRAGLLDVTLNRITLAHEVGHIAFDMFDMYASTTGAGQFDLADDTADGSAADGIFDDFWAPAAWWKVHVGWITPTVVTKDGYYDVERARNPSVNPGAEAFVLYDYGRGTKDYLLVENRQPQAGTPDAVLSDSGLAVWRVSENHPNGVDPQRTGGLAPFEMMRPDATNVVMDDRQDLFDADDPATPERKAEPTWQDGTASKVAVRAIGNSRATMRAYFDVRGPGVLVDTYGLDSGDTQTTDLPHLSPGDAGELKVPVMNTGEAADTFELTVTDLPAGWQATTPTATLQPGQQQDIGVQVTPALGARADTTYTLNVRGRSTSDGSVSSTSPVRVRVLPKLSIDDVTVTEGDSGTQDATFTVSLSEPSDRSVGLDFVTADGTATAPSDYEATSGGFSISAGATSRRITVSVNGDTAVEPDEHFFVRLSNVSRAKLVDAEGRGTILTDPEPSLSIDDVRIEEDDTNATFTVALSEANNTPVSVDFKTSDATATSPSDYSATNGSLDFPVGQTRRTIAVPIKEDVADEIDEETFKVTLSNVAHATIADGDGVGTIRDDDRNGIFSCRATGVRLGDSERGVANPPRTPCRDDRGSGWPLQLGSGGLSVSSATGSASTGQAPDDLTGTQPQAGDRASAHAEASSIVIRAGVNVIHLSAFVSDAKAECTGSGPPRLTASSRVTVLAIGGRPIVTTAAKTTIPLVLATLRLNETVVDAKGITQRALVVDNALGSDIVLGEARAGFDGTAVHPDGHPCVV